MPRAGRALRQRRWDVREIVMADATSEDLKTLRAEMANLRADLGKIGDALRSLVRHGGEAAADKATEAAESLKAEIGNQAARLTKEIEQRPLTAVLAAFGLGMLLGMLFGGRRS
jgi:ElaB/YqjD/DUF883 family membrane-anchored ribosome-binding protein